MTFAIYEHIAALLEPEPISPRMAELDEILGSGTRRRKKIPGPCRFCGHRFESGLAVRKHERICKSRPTPRRRYPKRDTTSWVARREAYLNETGKHETRIGDGAALCSPGASTDGGVLR